MSYVSAGVGWVDLVVEGGARLATDIANVASGKSKKAARTARNVEQAARIELEAAQATARGAQQAAQVTAQGQVAAAAARVDAQKQALAKRNRMILIGSAAVVGLLGLGFVGYRLTRTS